MQKSIKLLIVILSALLLGCDNNLKTNTSQKHNEGSLRLGVSIPEPQNTTSATAAFSRAKTSLALPEIANFSIKIFRLSAESEPAEIFAELYGKLPYLINLTEGDYRIEAQIGNRDIFSVENPLYFDGQDFTVTRGQTTSMSLSATIVPYVVRVNYSKDFATNFESFYLEAEINDRSGYIFANHDSDNNTAYIMPSKARLMLKGVLKDGADYSSVIKEIDSPGKELYTLNLNILPKGHSIDISVNTTRTEISSQGDIPLDNLPELPAISATPLEFYETMATPIEGSFSAVTFSGIAGIASIEFTPTGDGFAALGLVAGTAYNTSNASDLAALTAAGVSFPASWAGQKSAIVDFSAVAQALMSDNNATSDHLLQCIVTDITGKVGALSTLTFRIHPAAFSMPEVLAGDVWTKSATASPLQVEHGDLNYMVASGRLKYQLSNDNTTWSDLTAEQLTPIANLSHNTTYYLRALYRDVTTNTVNFTTETQTQLPNAGFEDWRIDKANKKYHHYKPWNDNVAEWWNTSNTRCFTYNFTNTQYNNPTSVLYTKDAKSGGKTAEIRSVNIDVGGRSNVCGKLLVGSLTSGGTNGLVSGNNNPEYLTEGRDFGSRPTKIRFWYKYEKYESDNYVITVRMRNGDIVIGEAVITGDQSVTDYTQMEIEIPYSRTDLKATSLYICFASSKDDGFPNRTINVLYPDGWDSGWKAKVGSILFIDDVELIYDK